MDLSRIVRSRSHTSQLRWLQDHIATKVGTSPLRWVQGRIAIKGVVDGGGDEAELGLGVISDQVVDDHLGGVQKKKGCEGACKVGFGCLAGVRMTSSGLLFAERGVF
eukprot:1369099-Amorphochlora_amoeboformis.AAC.1